ncbi:MAG: FecR family protein [Leptospirales bacterium]|nr:FecR family protein [Leptospirales bacterium]
MKKVIFLAWIFVSIFSCKNSSETPVVRFVLGEAFLLKGDSKTPLKVGDSVIFVSIFSCKNSSETPVVRFVLGEAFLLKGDSKTPLKVGDSVNAVKLETGANSLIDIAFGTNILRVLEKSVVDIKEFSEKTDIFLSKGGVFSNVGKKLAKDDSYVVATPTTTAAVRGTDFLVRADSGTSLAACLNGKLAVSKTDGSQTVELNAGQEIEAEQGKHFQPKELSEENRNRMRDILSDLRKSSAAAKIIPHMPPPESKKMYKVQVGSYIEQANAEEAAERLRSIGYKPAMEKFKKYHRVVISGVRAGDIPQLAGNIGGAGFAEGWLQE